MALPTPTPNPLKPSKAHKATSAPKPTQVKKAKKPSQALVEAGKLLEAMMEAELAAEVPAKSSQDKKTPKAKKTASKPSKVVEVVPAQVEVPETPQTDEAGNVVTLCPDIYEDEAEVLNQIADGMDMQLITGELVVSYSLVKLTSKQRELAKDLVGRGLLEKHQQGRAVVYHLTLKCISDVFGTTLEAVAANYLAAIGKA